MLRAGRAVENTEDGESERIAADKVIAHEPRRHHGGKDEENKQPAHGARLEPRKDEDEEAEKNPRAEWLGQGHEPEKHGGRGEQEEHAPGAVFLPRLHGPVQNPESGGEEEQHEHLRQSRSRKAPQQIGEKNESATHPCTARIKEGAHEEKENEDRGDEEGDARRGNGHVADVDGVGRLHRPPTLDGAQHDGVEQRVEREVVNVRHQPLGQRFAVVEKLPNGEWSEVERGEAGPGRDLTADLGLIHGCFGIKSAEINEKVEGGQTRHGGNEEGA